VGDKAILAIYDNLTHETVVEKVINATPDMLTFTFTTEDTMNLEPSEGFHHNRYSWDITIQRNPLYDENQNLIHYDDVDSYYAAYKLPPCVIKRVTRNVQK